MWDNENIFCQWKPVDQDIHSLWKKAVNFKGYQAHAAFLNFCTCELIFDENFIWLGEKKPLVLCRIARVRLLPEATEMVMQGEDALHSGGLFNGTSSE